jgi:bla regulator protein BlaR1
MPALFVFLFKVNIALLLFCAGYYMVLRQLTFYTLNRAYLVAAIIFASLYPKIDLTGFAQRHETLARPLQTAIYNWQVPAQTLMKPLTQPDYWNLAEAVFWTGAALLAMRLMMQLFSLLELYRSSKPAIIHNHNVRLMQGQAAPFSFWRSIYVNPANHSPAELEAILQHEQVHVNGWHTIDILLAELSSIFYWFNPGIWLIKKAVRENIEFITDRKILNKGFDSKAYQYSLVNVSFNTTTPGIVNHFNISTIKKRIIMMNAKRSPKAKLTRYALVIPAVIAMLLVFTLSKAEITRPISLEISNAIKPVAIAIKQAAKDAMAVTDTVPARTVKAVAVKKDNGDKTVAAKVYTFSTRGDTAKKSSFSISGSTNMDSVTIFVNGKKVKPSELSIIDPSKIASVNILTGTAAKSLLNRDDNVKLDINKNVAFITTTDSEAGKLLAGKLSTKLQLNHIKIATSNLHGGNDSFLNEVVILDSDSTNVHELKSTPDLHFRAKSNLNIPLTKIYTGTGNLAIAKTYNTKGSGSVFFTNSTNVNRISDKVIVIDGKQASEKEMKKLSAFDIDRISVSSDADSIKKYGDKAKYGVVYMYTKKGK